MLLTYLLTYLLTHRPQNLYMLMEVAPGGELFQRVADNERLGLR